MSADKLDTGLGPGENLAPFLIAFWEGRLSYGNLDEKGETQC